MRIKVLRSLGRDLPDYLEGQVVDCKQPLAGELIAKGLAAAVQEPEEKPAPKAKAATKAKAKPKPIEAVPDAAGEITGGADAAQ